MNGAVKSLIALLGAIENKGYEVYLFVSSHDGELQHLVPSYVKILPEEIEYAVFRLPLKQALIKAAKNWRFDLLAARALIGFGRKLRLKFFFWPMLPQINGSYDLVCAYADGFVAQVATKKVSSGKKALWIHCDYTQYRQSKETFKAFEKADIAVSVSKDSIEKFKLAYGGEIKTPFAVVHNIIDIDDVKRRAKDYEVPPVGGGGGDGESSPSGESLTRKALM